MKRTLTTILALILLGSFAASVYYSPYWTLYKMKVAIEDKDAEGLSRRVDYAALRASMKSQVKSTLRAQTAQLGEPMQGLNALAEGLMDQMLEAMVSPQAVAAMMSGAGASGQPGAAPGKGEEAAKGDAKPRELALHYRSWDQALFSPEGEQGGFLFQRDGLWSWKLAGVDLGLARLAQPR